MLRRFPFRRHRLFYGFVAGALLSLLFLVLSAFLPRLATSNYYQKSLGTLRKQAQSIKKEFASLQSAIQLKQATLVASSLPTEKDKIFELFKSLSVNPEIEGLAYYNEAGELAVWLGNVVDFCPALSDSFIIVRNKASVYLISSQKIRQSEAVVFSRLLAFLPQLRAPYLKDYHFLSPKLLRNCHIDYSDFREDVSGFEDFFARHKDEYIGQPRLENVVQTIFFPLRNDKNEIVATLNLSSPSLLSSQTDLRESLLLFFTLLLTASLILLILYLVKTYLLSKTKQLPAVLFLILALTGLRLIFLPLSRLEKIQSLPSFSPAQAGFFSLGGLTQSPADIFLTSLFLFLVIGSLALLARNRIPKNPPKIPEALAWFINPALLGAAVVFLLVFERAIGRLVANANLNLLRFRADLSSLLLHLSLVFFLLSLSFLAYLAMRAIHLLSPRFWKLFLVLLIVFLFLQAAFDPARNILLLALRAAALVLLFLLARRPVLLKKKGLVFGAVFLAALYTTAHIHLASSVRLRSLIQNFLRQTIVSQENWADFLLRQSLPEIEKRKESLLSFLELPDSSPFARSLWENTLVAKFNWYSTLEVLNPEGEILSRFSLNIPKLYRPDLSLEVHQTWTVSRLIIPSLGKEREFLLAYKDWFSNNRYLGRTTLSLAVDPEMLPFLYSGNPYFELLKVSSFPSLHQEDFGFAIFDDKGKILFNPNRISLGLSPDILERVSKSGEAVWDKFTDRGRAFDSFYFRLNARIYALFMPQKNFISLSVEFLKLFFFDLGLMLIFLLALRAFLGRKNWGGLLWSFSSRVYAGFIAITVIALLLFSFFSHSFFTTTFSRRFIEKAEIHANFARNVMQDFIFLQQEEGATLIAPTDDLVLWISSAIANDVSLYQEGRLVSSSRREFFDWGLLPELIDGESYFKIRHSNEPFHTQRQKIGSYSFQSLTIPYTISQSQFLISLPFPFEEQEIAKATEELVEFLVFISFFFIAVVLLFARGMGQMIISPVQKLLAGTKEVSLGNLEISVEHKSHDEMKTLIDGFNTMIQNLKKHQQEIADLGKKVAWAELAQKVAHEIKNPLTPIQLSAEHLLRVYEDKKGDFEKALRESTSYIIGEVDNLRKIAQEFLELSKAASLKKERFDLKAIIEEVVLPYKKMLSERIKFREIYEGQAFPLDADRSKIKIAFRNIFINAVEAIRGKGTIEIRLAREGKNLKIEVEDTGVGMARDVLEKIFDPYFSTKDVGTGLGLPIAKKIIEDHLGSIQVASEISKGTILSITLPCPDGNASR